MSKFPTWTCGARRCGGWILCSLLAVLAFLIAAFALGANQFALAGGFSGASHDLGLHKDLGHLDTARFVLVGDKAEAPLVTPYSWQVVLKNKQLIFSGHVPSEESRDALISAAEGAFKRHTIVDKMMVGTGEPRDWLATAVLALEQLAMLQEGKVSLNDTVLNLEGLAQRQETVERIDSALRAGLTSGYIVQKRIKYQQAATSAVRPFKSIIDFRDGRFQLSGHAPGKMLQDRLLAAIKSARSDAAIVNDMTIATGAPENWLNCALAGLKGLLMLEEGSVQIVDDELILSGLTRQEEIGEALPKQLRAAANRACRERVNIRVETPPEPSLKWYARYHDRNLQISGEVPNSEVQDALTRLVGQLFPGVRVTSNLRVNPSRTGKWQQVVDLALESLAKLRRGEARIDAQLLTLTGEAKDAVAETAIRQQIKSSMPKGYKARVHIQVKSAAMLWAERQARGADQRPAPETKAIPEPGTAHPNAAPKLEKEESGNVDLLDNAAGQAVQLAAPAQSR